MKRIELCYLIVAVIVTVAAVPVSGATWQIYADGSGDAPTITAAVAAAVAGDSIKVHPGIYYEHDIQVTKQLFIVSTTGSYDAIIDAQSLGRCFLFDVVTPLITVNGLQMRNGNSLSAPINSSGGAVLCRNGAQVNFPICIFYQNTAATGGAVAIEGGCTVAFNSCTFIENDAVLQYGSMGYGGAISMLGYGTANPVVSIDFSLFINNSAITQGGALSMNYCQATLTRCSFYGNNVTDTQAGSIDILSDVSLTMDRTIVSFSNCYGILVRIPLFTASLSCCDVYGNTSGNYGGYITDQTGSNNNISADPIFCAAPGLLTISSISPCAPAYSPCGQLIGCGSVACDKGPNLVVAGVQWSSTVPQPGTNITGTVKIKNPGNMNAGPFYIDYFKNSAVAPPPGQHGDERHYVASLAAGDSVSWTTSPVTSAFFGEWQSYFRVDTDAQVLELSENDNLGGPYTIAWQVPNESGWPTATGAAFHSSPVIASIDDDPMDLEVAIGCDNGKLYVWKHDGTAAPGFPVTLDGAIHSSPAVGDVCGDLHNEIVVGCDDGRIYVFDAEGSLLWRYLAGEVAIATTPSLADLNGDGKLEIICTTEGAIHVLDGDGKPLDGWPYLEKINFVGNAVGDVDWDGDLEIAAVASSGESVSKVYLFEANGELHSTGWPVQLDAVVEDGPAIGNIEAFPIRRLEIVVGATSGRVYMIRTDGSVWTTVPQVTGSITSSPIIEDVDENGHLDIVVTSKIYALGGDPPVMRWNGYVTAINSSGSIMPGWPQPAGYWPSDVGPVPSAVALGAKEDAMVGSPGNSFFAWYGNGVHTDAFPIYLGANVVTSAAAGDVDGDGWVELFVATSSGQVHGRELRSDAYTKDELWWPMYGHDRDRTHCYGFDVASAAENNSKATPAANSISAIFPNPFNPSTRIVFDLEARGPVKLAVYDVTGRLVAVLVNRVLEAGRHEASWDGLNSSGLAAPSGVYFCRLSAGETAVAKKMVLLK